MTRGRGHGEKNVNVANGSSGLRAGLASTLTRLSSQESQVLGSGRG